MKQWVKIGFLSTIVVSAGPLAAPGSIPVESPVSRDQIIETVRHVIELRNAALISPEGAGVDRLNADAWPAAVLPMTRDLRQRESEIREILAGQRRIVADAGTRYDDTTVEISLLSVEQTDSRLTATVNELSTFRFAGRPHAIAGADDFSAQSVDRMVEFTKGVGGWELSGIRLAEKEKYGATNEPNRE